MPRRPTTAPPPLGPAARGTWRTAVGVHLTVLVPNAHAGGHPPLDDWWPLHRAARWAALVDGPGLIHLDEFELVGTYARATRPDVWVYRHRRSARELFVDHHGCTYELRPLRTDPRRGRFHECGPRQAVARAGLSSWATPGRLPLLEVVRGSVTDDVFPVPAPVPPDDPSWVRTEPARSPLARRGGRAGRPALAAVLDLRLPEARSGACPEDRPEGFDHYVDALRAARRLHEAEGHATATAGGDGGPGGPDGPDPGPGRWPEGDGEPGPGPGPDEVEPDEHDDLGCGDPSCERCYGSGEASPRASC